jgi:hypothetical protein
MFEKAQELLTEYTEAISRHPVYKLHPHLLAEVSERLRQLDYIVDRVRAGESSHDDSMKRFGQTIWRAQPLPSTPGTSLMTAASPDVTAGVSQFVADTASATLELRVMSEAFYYFAARVRSALKHKGEPLPLLRAFEAPGVRGVRNHLIEHPERDDSRVFVQSFSFGGPQGPVLKGGRPPSEPDVHADAGLYQNAEEFRINLEGILRAAISKLGSLGPGAPTVA